jgi:hypothetical protein
LNNGASVISNPSKNILPFSGFIRPAIVFSNVVLPAPFDPSSKTVSPLNNSILILLITHKPE